MSRSGQDYRGNAAAIAPATRLLEAAREHGVLVVHTRYVLRSDYSDAGLLIRRFPHLTETGALLKGTPDIEIVSPLAPRDDELVVDKNRPSAFMGTGLDAHLSHHGIGTLVVCGVTSNFCVESTVRDAFARDYRVVVASDAVGATRPEFHQAAMTNFSSGFADLATTEQIVSALQQQPTVA